MDLKLTDDGDLVLDSNGDLVTVSGDEELAQAVRFRLKTLKGDYTLAPSIGTSLEQFIGEENSPDTRSLIESTVSDSLTFDNLLINPSVRCIPLSENEIFILVEFPSTEDDDKKIQLSSSLDLKRGFVFDRIDSQIL